MFIGCLELAKIIVYLDSQSRKPTTKERSKKIVVGLLLFVWGIMNSRKLSVNEEIERIPLPVTLVTDSIAIEVDSPCVLMYMQLVEQLTKIGFKSLSKSSLSSALSTRDTTKTSTTGVTITNQEWKGTMIVLTHKQRSYTFLCPCYEEEDDILIYLDRLYS